MTRWIALWTVTVAASLGAMVPVLFGSGAPVEGPLVVYRLVGISFAVCGLIAWRRRPDSHTGRLMVLTGYAFLISPLLDQLAAPAAITGAALLWEIWAVPFAAVVLSFLAGGRLESTRDRLIVASFALPVLVLQFVALLFVDVDVNVLNVFGDTRVAEAIDQVQRATAAASCLATVAVVASWWAAASAPRRRALLPSVAGAACLGLFAALLIDDLLPGPRSQPLIWVANCSLALLPLAFLAGLLRSRLARAGLAELFRETRTLRGSALQSALARALGDPSLVLACDGVPKPAPGRAVAPIHRDGRPVAALVYDASLDEDPALVDAVAGAAAIALENEGLLASRERIVAAGDAERRQLERELHGGAQQRLVALALQLKIAQGRMHTDPDGAERMFAEVGKQLAMSLDELRDLARAIHPAVLDHGLAAALDSLAVRSPVHTTVSCFIAERLPEQVELAAYHVASEALENAARHASAHEVSVRVQRAGGGAVIEIADDGVGGADAADGMGLRALADRVEALDGSLRVVSPPGGGTVVTAELPCAS
jgi:signal transduction histidine kinase